MNTIILRTNESTERFEDTHKKIEIGRKVTGSDENFAVKIPFSHISGRQAEITIDSIAENGQFNFTLKNLSKSGTKCFVGPKNFCENFDEENVSFDMFCVALAEAYEAASFKKIVENIDDEVKIPNADNLVICFNKTHANTLALIIFSDKTTDLKIEKKKQTKTEDIIKEKEKAKPAKKRATKKEQETTDTETNANKEVTETIAETPIKKERKSRKVKTETPMEEKEEIIENENENKTEDNKEEKTIEEEKPAKKTRMSKKKIEAKEEVDNSTAENKKEKAKRTLKKSDEEKSQKETKKTTKGRKSSKKSKKEESESEENSDEESDFNEESSDSEEEEKLSQSLIDNEEDEKIIIKPISEELKKEIEENNKIDENDIIYQIEKEENVENSEEVTGIAALPIVDEMLYSDYLAKPDLNSPFWYSNTGLKLTQEEKDDLMDPDAISFFKKSKNWLDIPGFMVVDEYKRNIKFLMATQRGLPIIKSKYLKVARAALDGGLQLPNLRNYMTPIQADDLIAQDLSIEEYIDDKKKFSFTKVLANSFRRPLNVNILHGVTHSICTYETLYYNGPAENIIKLLADISAYYEKEEEVSNRNKPVKKSSRGKKTEEKEEEKPIISEKEKEELEELKENSELAIKKLDKLCDDYQNLLQLTFLMRFMCSESCMLTDQIIDDNIVKADRFKDGFFNENKKIIFRESFPKTFVAKIAKELKDKQMALKETTRADRIRTICTSIFTLSEDNKIMIFVAPLKEWDQVYSTDEGKTFIETIKELKKQYGEKIMLVDKFGLWYSILTYQDLFEKLEIKLN